MEWNGTEHQPECHVTHKPVLINYLIGINPRGDDHIYCFIIIIQLERFSYERELFSPPRVHP